MSADCCTFECDQGRDCPARKAKVAPSTHYCTKSRQPCATPYTCSAACRLTTANSDGSSPHAPQTSTRPTLRWFAVLAVSTALAALCTVQAARFFN